MEPRDIASLLGHPKSPLDDLSIEDILNHLAGRYASVVVVWETHPTATSPNDLGGITTMGYSFRGSIAAVLGMGRFLDYTITHNPPEIPDNIKERYEP